MVVANRAACLGRGWSALIFGSIANLRILLDGHRLEFPHSSGRLSDEDVHGLLWWVGEAIDAKWTEISDCCERRPSASAKLPILAITEPALAVRGIKSVRNWHVSWGGNLFYHTKWRPGSALYHHHTRRGWKLFCNWWESLALISLWGGFGNGDLWMMMVNLLRNSPNAVCPPICHSQHGHEITLLCWIRCRKVVECLATSSLPCCVGVDKAWFGNPGD